MEIFLNPPVFLRLLFLKKEKDGAGELPRCLRTLAALAEKLGLVWWLTIIIYSRRSDDLS